MQRTTDIAIIAAIAVLAGTILAGLFVDVGRLKDVPKVVYGASVGYAVVVYLIAMIYCLGVALDLPRGTEKNLWIIGILFATVITVPYFYFARARATQERQEPNQSPQTNAGSRPPPDDSPASEPPSSPAPRG